MGKPQRRSDAKAKAVSKPTAKPVSTVVSRHLVKSANNPSRPAPSPDKSRPGKPWPNTDPEVDALVNEVIGRVADKWTMLILEVLADHGELRFTRIGKLVPGISQKMLTQSLRQMERDGLIVRTVHPVIPPKVEYRLTDLGIGLGTAFCGVWLWAEQNLNRIQEARARFDGQNER